MCTKCCVCFFLDLEIFVRCDFCNWLEQNMTGSLQLLMHYYLLINRSEMPDRNTITIKQFSKFVASLNVCANYTHTRNGFISLE